MRPWKCMHNANMLSKLSIWHSVFVVPSWTLPRLNNQIFHTSWVQRKDLDLCFFFKKAGIRAFWWPDFFLASFQGIGNRLSIILKSQINSPYWPGSLEFFYLYFPLFLQEVFCPFLSLLLCVPYKCGCYSTWCCPVGPLSYLHFF